MGSGKIAFDEALTLSPKAIVIADATAIDAAVSQQLMQASCLVIPAMTLGANLSQIHMEEIPEKIGLIHSRHTSQGDVNAAIFEHLVGLASVVNRLTDVRLLSVVSNGYVASAKNADGVEVTWSGLAGVASAYYELDRRRFRDRTWGLS